MDCRLLPLNGSQVRRSATCHSFYVWTALIYSFCLTLACFPAFGEEKEDEVPRLESRSSPEGTIPSTTLLSGEAQPHPKSKPDSRDHPQSKKQDHRSRRGPDFSLDRSPSDAGPDGMELPPPARERFRKNLQRWNELTPEQKEHFRARQREYLVQIQEEINQLIVESGMEIDEDLRRALWRRYGQDRRNLERQLREEMDTQRTLRLPALRREILNDLQAGRIKPMPPPPSKEQEATEGQL